MTSLRALVAAWLAVVVAVNAGAFELHEGIYSPIWMSLPNPFVQWGGTASVQTIRYPFNITLQNGVFRSGKIDLGRMSGYAYFTQNGGQHINSNGIALASARERFVNRGSWYGMNGGVLKTPYLGAGGEYVQTGGRTVATQFVIPGGGHATVEDGILNTTSLAVSGIDVYYYVGWSGYIPAGFQQVGGTVTTGDFLVSSGAGASVESGTLAASNITVSGYMMDGYLGPSGPRRVYASFKQRGGRILISQRLNVHATYLLETGSLTAPVIMVSGHFTAKSADIVNTQRFTLAGGKLEAHVSLRLGPLAVRTNGATRTISELTFYAPGVVQFRNSSLTVWNPGAYLLVKGWRGLPQGGGENQFRVGDSDAGLTREQVAQIIFENPENLPAEDYSGRILSSGEVVPDAPVGIRVTRGRNRMVLAWREPYYLETTTNLANQTGWTTVTQASPMAVAFSEPQRYFRMRR